MKKTIQTILISTVAIFTMTFSTGAQTAKRDSRVAGKNVQSFQSAARGSLFPSRNVSNGWEVGELVRVATRYIDEYWREAFRNGRISHLYTPPTVMRSSQRIQNAYFSPRGNLIVYDYSFFYEQLHKHGDFAVVTIMAHEWGHAVQHMLKGKFVGDIERELQADCYAGAFARRESRTTRLESNDVPKAISSLIEAGDSPATNIFSRHAHGSAEKRRKAFYRGFQGGLDNCRDVSMLALFNR